MQIIINNEEFDLIKSGVRKNKLLIGEKFIQNRFIHLLVMFPIRREIEAYISSIEYSNSNNTIINFEVIEING